MKDEVDKVACRNEKQIKKRIEEGAKYIIAYFDVKVSKETAEEIREKQIRVIGLPRKRKGVKRNDNKASKNNK